MSTLQSNSTLQGGKYKIEKVLGQGGFGITYLGVQSGLERKVAIKEFFMKELCERDESTSHVTLGTTGSIETVNRFREKFLKEARNIAKLDHPNIVSVIDVFEENGTAYYVMKYAEKGSLSDKVKLEGYLTEPVATRYILQVAEALDYIHQQKMNHLDVKPANIMLTEKDEAVLIDFGLSKQYDAVTGSQTSTTPVGISHGYAPMEQYREGGVREFSPETDIYALGATFFKLLTGVTPPSASDIMEDGVPVNELNTKAVSNKVISVICKAMESRKKDRINSVRTFIVELKGTSSEVANQNDSNTADESTVVISESDSRESKNGDPTKSNTLSKEDIRQKAMAQYLAEERAAAEKKAIEEEVKRIKEEERIKRLAEEETIRKEEEECRRAIEEEQRIINKMSFLTNGVEFNMKRVEGGTFDMKETVSCGFLGLSSKEIVQKTTLSDYWIGETQVTQALWKAVMGNNPSRFQGDNLPVERVSWKDCHTFISKLNSLTGKKFRLPTEAEWEFAAQGGNKSKHHQYSGSNNIDDVAWYEGNSGYKTHPVATKQANELGIYDMSGNVWEWCSDWYGNYSRNSQINPIGPNSGTSRVYRGGSRFIDAGDCRSSCRSNGTPDDRYDGLGLRLCLSE